jgi:hypothetical protein
MAVDFRDSGRVRAPLYTDPSRSTYEALGAKRTVAGILDPRGVAAAARSFAAGFRQGATAGDALQLGGELVVRPDGSVAFLHLARFAGDHAAVDDVLAAI